MGVHASAANAPHWRASRVRPGEGSQPPNAGEIPEATTNGVSAMDDYLDGLPGEQRAAFERVRSVVTDVAPEAEEGESYGMPAYIYSGRPLLAFRAAKNHLSVFPFSPEAIEAVEGRLEGFDLSKGTIRFTPDKPVPDEVLADLVRARMGEISGG